MKKISIINYGLSNLLSVEHAFQHCGAQTEVISTPIAIEDADVLILPGVGAFKDGMRGLEEKKLSKRIILPRIR